MLICIQNISFEVLVEGRVRTLVLFMRSLGLFAGVFKKKLQSASCRQDAVLELKAFVGVGCPSGRPHCALDMCQQQDILVAARSHVMRLLDDDNQPILVQLGVEPSRIPPCHFKPGHLATSGQIRASSPDVPQGQTGSPVRDTGGGNSCVATPC